MIRPKLEAVQLTIAEEQEEYKSVTAAVVQHPDYPGVRVRLPDGQVAQYNSIVLAFRPTDEERAKLVAGEDLYVSLLTFGKPMQGIILTVGPQEFAQWFGVEVEK